MYDGINGTVPYRVSLSVPYLSTVEVPYGTGRTVLTYLARDKFEYNTEEIRNNSVVVSVKLIRARKTLETLTIISPVKKARHANGVYGIWNDHRPVCSTSVQEAWCHLRCEGNARSLQVRPKLRCCANLQDPIVDRCDSTLDSYGKPCELCTLQGSINICLNQEQASLIEKFGVNCNGASILRVSLEYVTSCATEFLQDQTKRKLVWQLCFPMVCL